MRRNFLLGLAPALLLFGQSGAAQDQYIVAGRVIDAATGKPIAGAEVRGLDADSSRAVTDVRGMWRLVLSPVSEVQVRALGYRVARARGTAAREVALTALPLALDRIVVTAARRQQRLAETVVTTEVVTREEIDRTGASDLASALMAVTGVEVAGGMPAGEGVVLQGIGSERVLILLDGHPVPGRIAGEFDISRIPTSLIERLEIVKGPQSALYGSEAMGGVVNIITRRPAVGERSVAGTATVGSFSRRDGTAALTGSIGSVAVRAEAGRRSTATAPGRADERGALAQRIDGSLRAEWRASPLTSIDVNVLALDERQRWLSGSLYTFGDNLQLTARATATRETVRGSRTALSVYGSSYDHLSRASVAASPIRGDTGQRQVQRLFQSELSYSAPLGSPARVLDAAVLLRRDDTESVRIPGGRRALWLVEPSAQFETQLGSSVSATVGSRLSASERWGAHFTPRLAARYTPVPSWTYRASVGTGFRAPDFRELYMRFANQSVGYAVHGNEALRPERSFNAMLGGEWTSAAAFVRVQLFHNEFRGFIETRVISAPDQPPLYQYANVDDGYTRGVEVEGAAIGGPLRVDAALTGLQTLNRAEDAPLFGRSPMTARATLTSSLPLRARGSLTALYFARTPMLRSSAGETGYRDAYPRFDARLAREIGWGLDFAITAENALDRRPAAWAGFTGRRFAMSLTAAGAF